VTQPIQQAEVAPGPALALCTRRSPATHIGCKTKAQRSAGLFIPLQEEVSSGGFVLHRRLILFLDFTIRPWPAPRAFSEGSFDLLDRFGLGDALHG
jgi:hypothetical protein